MKVAQEEASKSNPIEVSRGLEIKTLSDLKAYLLQVRPLEANGDRILKYRVRSETWHNGPKPIMTFVESVVMGKEGTYNRFYGYVADVLHNANKGLLEPKEDKQ